MSKTLSDPYDPGTDQHEHEWNLGNGRVTAGPTTKPNEYTDFVVAWATYPSVSAVTASIRIWTRRLQI